MTGSYIACLKLGDGEILMVSDSGQVVRPFAGTDPGLGEQTESLCLERPEDLFQVSVRPATEPLPALIVVSTDGYPKSFRHDRGFVKAGSDFLDIIRWEGPKTVEKNLNKWLADASERGSGDDATVGLICRADIPPTTRREDR